MTVSAIIEITDLTKIYPGSDRPALDGLSLAIPAGAFFGLLGPNGAGKSTFLSILCGLLAPTRGQVRVLGMDVTRVPHQVKSILGLVPQDLALYPTLTARENLLFFGRMQGLTGARLRERVATRLTIARLEDLADRRAGTFSGGLKRRLNLVIGLIHEPKLLILDEPTVGIDPQSRHFIHASLRELHAAGMTILYSTHYMEEAEQLCDDVAIIDRGHILTRGTVPVSAAPSPRRCHRGACRDRPSGRRGRGGALRCRSCVPASSRRAASCSRAMPRMRPWRRYSTFSPPHGYRLPRCTWARWTWNTCSSPSPAPTCASSRHDRPAPARHRHRQGNAHDRARPPGAGDPVRDAGAVRHHPVAGAARRVHRACRCHLRCAGRQPGPGDGRPEAGRHLCRRSPLPGDAANRAAAGRHPEPPGEQRPVPVRLRDPGARHPPGARTRHRAGARRRTGPRPDRGGRGAAVRRSDPARRPSRHGGGVHQRRAARHRIHADRRAHRRLARTPFGTSAVSAPKLAAPQLFAELSDPLEAPSQRLPTPTSVQQNAPAWTLLAMFFLAVPLSVTFIKERAQGSLSRLQSMPVPGWVLLGSKVAPYLVINQIQLVLILAVGVWGLPARRRPPDGARRCAGRHRAARREREPGGGRLRTAGSPRWRARPSRRPPRPRP
ncbi:MAG: ATP-binding cassette domain-containing protein [Comamonadaceae bacterium]|nr:ATP-binding cassette domain-containing protein [Comamonadaceae bacterium]